MNVSTWSNGKKFLAIFLAIFFFVGVGVTVYLVQKQQELRSHAQKATVLTLSPSNQSVGAGGDAQVDVTLNPGTNQVNFVKLVLAVDENTFDVNSVAFTVDDNSPLKEVNDPTVNASGEVVVTLSVGSDPTQVVQATTKLGTFDLPVRPDSGVGTQDVTIDKDKTQVRSIGGNDAFNENVLNSVVNAVVTVTGGQCVPNQATCSWDAAGGASSYHYQIIRRGQSDDVIAEGDTSNTSITFDAPVNPGESIPFICKVSANNECGTSDEASGQSTCSVSPTPTISITPTITPTVTPTTSLTPTPTKKITSTPTPTTPGSTAAPTTPQTVVVTNVSIPTNVIAQGPTITPAPTLPPTGSPVVIGGIVGGILFLLGGLALILL